MTDVDNIEYVYTVGMDETDVAAHLERAHTGVLALADDGNAYAVPVSFHYDDGRLFLRMADDGSSKKLELLDSTARATFLVFDAEGEDDSWSVLIRGPVRELSGSERARFDAAAVNESFPPLRVFDETVEDLVVRVCEMDVEELTARKTV